MNVMIVGPSRSGKTYLAQRLLHYMSQEDQKQIVIFDEQESYATGKYGFDNIDVYGTNFFSLDKYMHFSFKKAADFASDANSHVLFNLSALEDANISTMLDFWTDDMNRYHNKIYVFEEAYRYVPKHKHSRGLLNFLRNAAKRGNDLIFIFQATQDIDLAVVRQMHFAFIFKLNRKEDQEQLGKSLSIPDDLMETQLKQYHFIVVNAIENAYGIGSADELFSDEKFEQELEAFSK